MERRRNCLAVFLGTIAIIAISLITYILLRRQLDSLNPELTPTPLPTLPEAVLEITPEPPLILENRQKFVTDEGYLIVEFLDDDLVHFELSDSGPGPQVDQPIYTTPMIAKTDYPGPSQLIGDGNGTLQTPDLIIQVDQATFCITATDKTREPERILTTICPLSAPRNLKRISLTSEGFTDIYGLGQKFLEPGTADGNWYGLIRMPGDYGNVMEGFNFGNVGNTQFPIAYFAGNGTESYALFLDNPYRQFWNFSDDPWSISMDGDAVRFFLMSGPDLQDLRKDYLELTGRPPVPPKKMFGLWISEYGYDSWAELDDKLQTLRANRFPVDGFVLDLQWYGGIIPESDDTQMGSLTWDTAHFPNPEQKIAELRELEGIGILTIEQPYIGKNLPEHLEMEAKGYLVRACEGCEPVYITSNPWWGLGGMLDFSNAEGAAFWHDWKREPLIDIGVLGHWTDLGEPELYVPTAWYAGIQHNHNTLSGHADIHNLYNFLWSQSINAGYQRNERDERVFILSRSGAPGIQRYGVAMWSGDIGANLPSLRTHFNAQMHMSMSGIDYYGSDIGGFYRPETDLEEIYTLWFANGAAFDIPVRPHTFNTDNRFETAPDRIGYLESNLANIRQRYELSPYLYSLAHRAYLFGEPVFPPLVYYYQTDPQVRELGNLKMIGRDLLVATVAERATYIREIYLPAGTWINVHTNEWIQSEGGLQGPFQVRSDNIIQLPTFARAGAILPQMYVDEQTMNILGKRIDGSQRDDLIVQVFADPVESSFTLYEDDGQTIAYQDGAVRTTLISQQQADNTVTVTIEAASGTYTDALESRVNVVKLGVNTTQPTRQVTLNGEILQEYTTLTEFEAAESGWHQVEVGIIMAKTTELPVSSQKVFVFQ